MIQYCWEGYFVFFPVPQLQCWELACVGVSHVNNNTKVLTWHSEQSSKTGSVSPSWWFSLFKYLYFESSVGSSGSLTSIQVVFAVRWEHFPFFFLFIHLYTVANKEETHDCKMERLWTTVLFADIPSCFSCFLDKVLVSWRAAMLFPHYQTDSVWKSNIPFTWKRKL